FQKPYDIYNPISKKSSALGKSATSSFLNNFWGKGIMGNIGDFLHRFFRFIFIITLITNTQALKAETVNEQRHIETLSRVMNLSQGLTTEDIERIRELKQFSYHQTAEAALIRLDSLFSQVVNIDGDDTV